MIHVYVIGIGSGNPEHMTVQAIKVLNRCDVLFVPTKGAEKSFLADLRREICARFITERRPRLVHFPIPPRHVGSDYNTSVSDWHAVMAEIYEQLLSTEVEQEEQVGLLVWGDPMLYDSTLRILEAVRNRGKIEFDLEVIPGITSLQVLCASHQTPLNQIGQPVQITTGRRLDEGWPEGVDSLAVLLDGVQAYASIDGTDVEIYWGAYLGTEMEITISGQLTEIAERINEVRAAARAEHGWIMDTYILRRSIKANDDIGSDA